MNTVSTNNGYWNPIAAGGPTNATALGPIYPFTSGYTAFAGDCPAEEPSEQGTVLAAGDSRIDLARAGHRPIGRPTAGGHPRVGGTVERHGPSPVDGVLALQHPHLHAPGSGGRRAQSNRSALRHLQLDHHFRSDDHAGVAVTVSPGSVTVGGTTSRLPTAVRVVGTMTGSLKKRVRQRIDRLQLDRRADNPESGMTLTELLIAFTVMILLMTVATAALTTYLNLGEQVISSYGNTEQVLTVATNLQKLVRAQVEPAPTPTTGANANIPSPPFSTVAGSDTGQYVGSTAVGTFSATFYSNVGNAAGPARIVATETANPVVGGHRRTWTFTVTQQIPDAGSCPFAVSSAKICTYNGIIQQPPEDRLEPPRRREQRHSHHGLSRHAASDRPAVHPDLHVHPAADLDGSQQSGAAGPGFGGLAGARRFLLAPPTGGEGRQHLPTCTATQTATPIANTCPGDAVQGVTIDLLIRTPGSPTPTEDNTTVFALSPTSYLYNPLVG